MTRKEVDCVYSRIIDRADAKTGTNIVAGGSNLTVSLDRNENVVSTKTTIHEHLHAAALPPMQSWRDAVRRNIEEIHTPFGSQPVGWKAAQIYAVY